jgi:hypothetical protein
MAVYLKSSFLGLKAAFLSVKKAFCPINTGASSYKIYSI